MNLAEDVARAAAHARAPNTRRAYSSAWERWEAYAFDHGASALPASPLVVAAYMAHLDVEGLSPSSLAVAMAAIVDRHRAARFPLRSNDPAVRDVLAGIRARRGTRPRAKAALSPTDLRAMMEALPSGLLGLRDRALLLVGFAAALRRAELVALDVAHVAWHREGIIVHVRRSKTDQAGEGADVPVHAADGPLCPVHALRGWLDATKIVGKSSLRPVVTSLSPHDFTVLRKESHHANGRRGGSDSRRGRGTRGAPRTRQSVSARAASTGH